MADNTQISAMTGGDTIRDVQRTAGGPKTQVVALDLGGANTNAEVLITAGQTGSAQSVPVVLSYDWTDPSAAQMLIVQRQMLMLEQARSLDGFVPLETPSIGV